MCKNKFNFFENAWKKDTNEHDDAIEKNNATTKRQKRKNTAIAIFSLICALLIWIYACSVSTIDMKYQSNTVTVKRVASVESKGYKVDYNTGVKVNYTLSGTIFAISQIPSKGVDIYADLSNVNLSEITDTKIIQLPLIIDLPADVSCTEKSQEYIEVVITKNSVEKTK